MKYKITERGSLKVPEIFTLIVLVLIGIEVIRRSFVGSGFSALEIEGGILGLLTFSSIDVGEMTPYLKMISFVLSFFLLAGVVYTHRLLSSTRKEQHRKLFSPEMEVAPEDVQYERWERVKDLSKSEKDSDWKIAIMEADIMLGELLNTLNYEGDSMGEQLKKIERSDFTTLDSAWEAHKVRNRIAHENDYKLIHRETRRVVALYEEVFREFLFI